MSYGVGRRRSSDPALLWLWCRPAATALIPPLAWETLYATGVALEMAATAAGLCQSHGNAVLSHVFNLHRSSREVWILNPLSKARN